MSYQGYSATPPPPGTITPTTTPYGYGAYPSPYAQIPTTGYTYPPGAYQAGVTGYGWSYPYSYVPQAHHQMTAAAAAAAVAHIQRPAVPAVPPPVVPHTPVTPAPAPPQRAATFTAYTPSYARESIPAHSTGRGGRRSSNMKGLFTKERTFILS
jgi:transcription initiation factor TFIID subunit 13